MTIKCVKYPQLHIHDLNVRFKDGAVEVNDSDVIEALQEMESFEFKFEGDFPVRIDREALKTRAGELGLSYPANIGTKKLAAMIEEAEAAKR